MICRGCNQEEDATEVLESAADILRHLSYFSAEGAIEIMPKQALAETLRQCAIKSRDWLKRNGRAK